MIAERTMTKAAIAERVGVLTPTLYRALKLTARRSARGARSESASGPQRFRRGLARAASTFKSSTAERSRRIWSTSA